MAAIIKVIGIGEYCVSDNCNDKIKTFALGSCVAVTVYSQYKKVGGMIHISLPYPSGDQPELGLGHFATTGIPLLINQICTRYKCLKGELVVNLYGGADSVYKDDYFQIGKRNIDAVQRTLSSLNLKVKYADIGGFLIRTIELDISTGEVELLTHPVNI